MKPTTWGRPLLCASRSKTTSCFHCYLFLLSLIYNVRSDEVNVSADADAHIYFDAGFGAFTVIKCSRSPVVSERWYREIWARRAPLCQHQREAEEAEGLVRLSWGFSLSELQKGSDREDTPFCSHCLQGLRSALVFHCLALCSIDLTSSLRKVEVAHAVTQQWPFYTLWWG